MPPGTPLCHTTPLMRPLALLYTGFDSLLPTLPYLLELLMTLLLVALLILSPLPDLASLPPLPTLLPDALPALLVRPTLPPYSFHSPLPPLKIRPPGLVALLFLTAASVLLLEELKLAPLVGTLLKQ